MNNNNNYRKFSVILSFSILIFNIAAGQTSINDIAVTSGDSLSLKYIIDRVVTSYPTVKLAEEAINNADARIGLARTGYNPEIDLTAAYSNIGPVVK